MLGENYAKACNKKYTLIVFGIVCIIVLGFYFSVLGIDVPLGQVFLAINNYVSGNIESMPYATINKIIVLLRLPRIILAIIAGVGLSVSGAVMQSITHNYLVSPFTLGISAAAAFGASVGIVFGNDYIFQSEFGIIGCAFISSCICGIIVYGIAKQTGIKPSSLVLVGISLNYLFSAMTATIEFFAKEHKLEAVVQWTFGTLNRASWESVLISSVIVFVGVIFIWQYSLKLNVMATNDDEMAKGLGISPTRIRTIGGLTAILLTSTIISFTGVIGFIGLIAPHMARFIIGNDHRFYLPMAAILGALLLLISDVVGKFILYPVNIPVGIIISFLGVPLFVHLILSRNNRIR